MYLPLKRLSFLSLPPIGIIDGGLWPCDELLLSREMKRKMNDFTPVRAGVGWNKECWHCDKYTDQSSKTWMNKQGTDKWHVLIVAQQTFSLPAPPLCFCIDPRQLPEPCNYTFSMVIMLMACQERSGGGRMPARYSRTGEDSISRLCLYILWIWEGQENRCRKMRRYPRWLHEDCATIFPAKIMKMK